MFSYVCFSLTVLFIFFFSFSRYCPAGTTVTIPCMKGTYGPTQQLASQGDCKGCDPGEFCAVDGLNQTSGNCSAGYFCRENASVSEPTDGISGKSFQFMSSLTMYDF